MVLTPFTKFLIYALSFHFKLALSKIAWYFTTNMVNHLFLSLLLHAASLGDLADHALLLYSCLNSTTDMVVTKHVSHLALLPSTDKLIWHVCFSPLMITAISDVHLQKQIKGLNTNKGTPGIWMIFRQVWWYRWIKWLRPLYAFWAQISSLEPPQTEMSLRRPLHSSRGLKWTSYRGNFSPSPARSGFWHGFVMSMK